MNVPWIHDRFVHTRRVRVLAKHFAALIRPDATLLDVGCGDGLLSAEIARQRPDVSVRGIDVLVRPNTAIPVDPFDGNTLPFEANEIDSVMMVDVLHHTESPESLLAEAARVAGAQVLIKDHFLRGFAAEQTLTFMDRVGNERHGVEIPCNYLTEQEWNELYLEVGLRVVECREDLGLYVPPLRWAFERRLHFLAALEHRS